MKTLLCKISACALLVGPGALAAADQASISAAPATPAVPAMPATPASPVVATAPAAAAAPMVDPLCAAPADAKRVATLYSATPAPMTFQAAPQLKLTEAAIASAIPADKAMGTTGTGFVSIWDSLTHWSGSLFLIMKGGNVFEISSNVSPGVPSTKSKFFNLGHDAPVSGHLRPDMVSAIYAMQLPAREGLSRAVMFYDAKGEGIFGVVAGSEGKELTPEQVSQFKSTWDLIAKMPRACTPRAAM